MSAIFLGLLAGAIHVLTGPDHMAAVAPLAAEGRRRAWTTGFVWGVGHTSGVWVVGLLALVLQGLLPFEGIASWSDQLANWGLVAIGLWGLHRFARAWKGKNTPPSQGQTISAHVACLLGILHGLAGTSHYLGILPALSFATPVEALVYLLGFGAATIGAMAGFAWGLGHMVQRASGIGRRFQQLLLGSVSSAALALGLVWLVF